MKENKQIKSNATNNNLLHNLGTFVLQNKALIVLILLSLIISIYQPNFFTQRNIINILRQTCVTAILGIGYTLVIASGNFDMSIGTQLGLCGILIAMMSKVMPLWLAFALGIVIGACFGMTNAFFINKFGLPPFIVTLASQSVFKGASYLITGMVPVTDLSEEFKFIGQGYVGVIPFQFFVLVLAFVAQFIIIKRTKLGRHALAIGGNSEAAKVCGVNVKKTRLYVYALMGCFAAIAAIVQTARSGSAQVAAGQGMEMDNITAVVIGGTAMKGGHANLVGTIVGGLLVGVVNNGLNMSGIDANWQIVAKGLLIMFALILDIMTTKILDKRRHKIELAKVKAVDNEEN